MTALDFSQLQEKLQASLKKDLPGPQAQYKMAPTGRPRQNLSELNEERVRKAAVLALFYAHQNIPHLVLTLRVQYGGVHSGQISLPGGRREASDRSFQETALRETNEEIGVAAGDIRVLGKLSPLYIPPSNFLVHPFVGIYPDVPLFKKQYSEVQEIIPVDFNRILEDDSIREQTVATGSFQSKVPVFEVENTIIWGATAMVLSELREMLLS